MAPQTGFWDRLQDEVRTGYERTRRTTRRTVRIGVLRVDLLSLRRDRSRALAQLGERANFLWNAGSLATLGGDEEALRLRSLIEGIERCIADKEAEVQTLRKEAEDGDAARPTDSASDGAAAGQNPDEPPAERQTGFTESGGPRPSRMEGMNGIS
jgi:hypothetical protein